MLLGEGFRVGFRGWLRWLSFGKYILVMREMGKEVGRVRGGGVGTGKSMRKLCQNYPLATYPLKCARKTQKKQGLPARKFNKEKERRDRDGPEYVHTLCTCFETPQTCYRSLSGPSGPKCPRECGVSKKSPESVPGVSKRCPGHSGDTLGTLFGHSGAWGPKSPRDTPKDTPGTLRARKARETPVAGRGGCNTC